MDQLIQAVLDGTIDTFEVQYPAFGTQDVHIFATKTMKDGNRYSLNLIITKYDMIHLRGEKKLEHHIKRSVDIFLNDFKFTTQKIAEEKK